MRESKEDKELGKMVKELVNETTQELKNTLPHVDLSPEISDAKVKQAILDITPEGMNKLYAKYGQEAVMSFITAFSRRRRW